MRRAEIWFVVCLVVGLLGPALWVHQYWLAFVFAVFFLCFGLVEWMAVKKTGRSVSQQFWAYSEHHRFGAVCVLGGMAIAWIALLMHLAAHLF